MRRLIDWQDHVNKSKIGHKCMIASLSAMGCCLNFEMVVKYIQKMCFWRHRVYVS